MIILHAHHPSCTYTTLLERAIIHLRYRLRSGETISPGELHDYLDALHNVPTMLKNYGNWMIEKNIDQNLAFYDNRWCNKTDSEMRISLLGLLDRIKRGESDQQ
jgi:hypothetical protein